MRRAPLALAATVATVLLAAGCNDDDKKDDSKASSSAPRTSEPATAQTATAPTASAPAAPATTADAFTTAPAAPSSPPKPDAATQARYIAALNAIDPEIVGGKEDKAVSRGRDQCTWISMNPNDRAKLIDSANQRFTSSGHPNGFGAATAEKIHDVVHTHICPMY